MAVGILLAMSAALAVGAFISGSLPLWLTLSHSHMHMLEALGTGLLLGAALGVIIPEGIEALISQATKEPPITQIAVSLLLGFTFMFILEQFVVTHHSHSHPHPLPHRDQHPQPSIPRRPVSRRNSQSSSRVEFDAELDLDQLERDLAAEGGSAAEHKPLRPSSSRPVSPHHDSEAERSSPQGARAITTGLIVHALADGLALGVSTLSPQGATPQAAGQELSLVVFLALLIHKAPTSLALTTTLLSKGLSRGATRLHLTGFSLATPVGALASYFFFSWISNTHGHDWTGLTLLFSGGTFLYVATVLQPVADTSSEAEQVIGNRTRAVFVILGMFIPFGIGALVGHGH